MFFLYLIIKFIFKIKKYKNMKTQQAKKDKEYKNKNKKQKEEFYYESESELSETEAGSTLGVDTSEPLLKEIANTLSSIISKNKESKTSKKENSPFSNGHIPKISLFDYLLRIKKYSEIENSTIIISLIYIDRICKRNQIILTKYNIHRILFTAILISVKYNEDIIYDNSFYSKVAGVPAEELISLEKAFLKMIGFELFISDEIYKKYCDYLNY